GSGTPTGTVILSEQKPAYDVSESLEFRRVLFRSPGTRTVTASYPGDGNYATSTSTGVGHTVNQAATATTITSVAPEPSTVGQATTVSFSVTSSSGTPTGTVTVSDGTEGCSGTVAEGGSGEVLTTVA